MAIHTNFSSLSRAMANRADEFEEGVERLVRKAAIVTATTAAIATPVDTGLARGNWRTKTGTLEDGILDSSRGVGAVAIEAQEATRNYRLGQDIWISNNIGYIVPLDEGSSLQAPNGMTDQAVAAGVKILQSIKIFRRN